MASRGSRGAAATAPRAARDPLSRSRENPVAAATAKPRARGAAASAAAASGAPSAPLPNIGAGGGGPSAPEGGAGSIAGAAGAPSGLAALGLPSLHAELRGVFERVGAGSDANAAAVLGRHVPKKTYVMDYKVRSQLRGRPVRAFLPSYPFSYPTLPRSVPRPTTRPCVRSWRSARPRLLTPLRVAVRLLG